MVRFALPLAVALMAAAPAIAQASPQCEIDRPVMFAGLSYDSAQFHTKVAQFIIENGYGCAVDALPGGPEVLINALGSLCLLYRPPRCHGYGRAWRQLPRRARRT